MECNESDFNNGRHLKLVQQCTSQRAAETFRVFAILSVILFARAIKLYRHPPRPASRCFLSTRRPLFLLVQLILCLAPSCFISASPREELYGSLVRFSPPFREARLHGMELLIPREAGVVIGLGAFSYIFTCSQRDNMSCCGSTRTRNERPFR